MTWPASEDPAHKAAGRSAEGAKACSDVRPPITPLVHYLLLLKNLVAGLAANAAIVVDYYTRLSVC